jgi:Domain of unknown function (DUF4440)
MKRSWLLLNLVLVAGAVAAPVASETSQAAKEVMATEKARTAALDHSDVAALERIMADDVTYIHASGKVDTKKSYLDAIRSGQLHYISWQAKNLQVRVLGKLRSDQWRVCGAGDGLPRAAGSVQYQHFHFDGVCSTRRPLATDCMAIDARRSDVSSPVTGEARESTRGDYFGGGVAGVDSASYSSGVFTFALTKGSGTATYSMYCACARLTSLALLVGEARRNASISSRFARSGCPCSPSFSGATPHRPRESANSNDESSCSSVAALNGGRSTGMIMAPSQPRARTSRKPTCRELNCPRSGSGFCTNNAPLA